MLHSLPIKKFILLSTLVIIATGLVYREDIRVFLGGEIHHADIEIVDILRNIDTVADTNIQVYFDLHTDGKTKRIPSQGYISLTQMQKAPIHQKLKVNRGKSWSNTSLKVYNNGDKLLGTIGFTPPTFSAKEKCENYTYILENIYPYKDQPSYVAPGTRRIKCFGEGAYHLEVKLRYHD